MACVLTLFSSVIGLSCAILALAIFQVPILAALAIWSGSGIACLGLALAVSHGRSLLQAT